MLFAYRVVVETPDPGTPEFDAFLNRARDLHARNGGDPDDPEFEMADAAWEVVTAADAPCELGVEVIERTGTL